MPARNIIKTYVPDGYYHLYNRGVEKRTIFTDGQDAGVFLRYLKEYLLPKDTALLSTRLSDNSIAWKDKDALARSLNRKNYYDRITLIAYCLMTNHFHLFVKQKNPSDIDAFMQSLCTRYTMYFNRAHTRVGSLFQSVYKAVLVTTDEQFLHLTRYIHKQALSQKGETLENQPSSFDEYLGTRKSQWVHPEEPLAFFSTNLPALSYKTFVLQNNDDDSISAFSIGD